MSLPPSRIALCRIGSENFQCAVVANYIRSHGATTKSTMIQHLQNKENNNSISWERICFVSKNIPMSLPELALGDESLLMVLYLSYSHQFHLVYIHHSRAEIFSIDLYHRCPNEFSYNDSFAQLTVCKSNWITVVSPFSRGLMIKLSYPQQQKLLIEEQQNNDQESPEPSHDMMCSSKEISLLDAEGVSISASLYSMRCSSTREYNNNPISPEVSFKMAPFSMIPDDVPPVLHLHKEPVTVTFPARMSCIIRPRPTRYDFGKTIH